MSTFDDDEYLPRQVLTGHRLRSLFAEVDAEITHDGPAVDVVICGGAALALHWDERATHDVDALGEFPRRLVTAIRAVGERHGLDQDWFNSAAARLSPRGLQTEQVYEGRTLKVLAATRPHLLAMKAFAARATDIPDIEGLMEELGVRSSQLCGLVQEAYDEDRVEARSAAISEVIAAISIREREREGRGRGMDDIGL